MSSRGRRWRESLAARITVVFLVLLLAVQVVSFISLRFSLAQHAQGELPTRLDEGEQLLHSLLDHKVQAATGQAQGLAKDFGFYSALLDEHDATIVSALDNFQQRVQATKTAFLGLDYELRHTSSTSRADEIESAIASLKAQTSASPSAIVLMGGRPYQAVLVQLSAPRPVGWILMAFPLDERLLSDMKRLSGLDLTLLARTNAREPWSVAMTTLDPTSAGELSDHAWGMSAPDGRMVSVPAQGDELGVRAMALGTDHRLDSGALALVSLSISDAVKLPADLRLALIVITLVAIAVFAAGSVVTARRVTTPLRGLADAAERLGAGDYATPMSGQTKNDEIGALSHAFERMRINVAENQAQILRLAYWDNLTGLPNRARFREAVGAAIQEAAARSAEAGKAIAVVMLDLNRFKHVNDVLGYAVGDQVLVGIAERLEPGARARRRRRGAAERRRVRHPAACDTDAQQAHAVALRVEQALEQPLAHGRAQGGHGRGHRHRLLAAACRRTTRRCWCAPRWRCTRPSAAATGR